MSAFYNITKDIYHNFDFNQKRCHSSGLTINHSQTQIEHYFLHLKPLPAVSLCQILLPPYITATHKTLYMFVALTNTTKQQESLAYTE
jgi:hypothetical protein